MQARHSSSGAVNDASGMIRTIIPHSLVKAILASHNETKSNRCSSMVASLRFRVSMQARHSSSGAVNDASGMIRTIIPHSLVKAILASHNETKSNRCSSMAVAQVWRFRVSMQARHSSSGAVNDASGMIRTIIPHSLVKAILASHNETKSNRCSSMASASE